MKISRREIVAWLGAYSFVLILTGCVHRNPAMLAAPRFVESEPLEVVQEDVRLRCSDADETVCEVWASYMLSNPSSEAVKREGLFFWRYGQELQLAQDGQELTFAPSDRPLPLKSVRADIERWREELCQGPPQLIDYRYVPVQCWEICELEGRSMDKNWMQICECPPLMSEPNLCADDALEAWLIQEQGQARIFSITLGPGKTSKLELTGKILPGSNWIPGWVKSAAHTRHFLLSQAGRCQMQGEKRCWVSFDYLPANTAAASDHRLSFEARWPKGWAGHAGLTRARSSSAPVPDFERESELNVQGEQKVATLQAEGGLPPQLSIEMRPEALVFHPGGPFVKLGAATTDFEGQGSFRAGLGWELAYPSWLLYSLGLETDFKNTLLVAPVVQMASSAILVIPSCSLGLGLPVDLMPDARVGVRIQLGAQWPVIGFMGSYDFFPSSQPRHLFSLYAVLSF